MADPKGESKGEALRLDFDRRLMLQFRGSVITSDGGLLAYREMDDALALTTTGGERLAEARTGKNRQHLLVGLLRQSVFGRLAGYEDVNDAALAALPGDWIDTVHQRRPPRTIVLDMDSSESPTFGAQEGSTYNGHFGCTCYHPLFVFNQLGDLERCALRSGNVHSAAGWRDV